MDYLASFNGLPSIFLNPTNPRSAPLTDNHALSHTGPPFALGHIFNPHPVGVPEGYPQCWVSTPYCLETISPRVTLVLGRHLSGPRLLLDPKRFMIRVIEEGLPAIPYVSRGVPWMLRTKYQGRDVSRAHSARYRFTVADFASAGTDATAQITLIPWPRTTIFLADAAAIKVWDTPPRIGLDVSDLWFVVYRR